MTADTTQSSSLVEPKKKDFEVKLLGDLNRTFDIPNALKCKLQANPLTNYINISQPIAITDVAKLIHLLLNPGGDINTKVSLTTAGCLSKLNPQEVKSLILGSKVTVLFNDAFNYHKCTYRNSVSVCELDDSRDRGQLYLLMHEVSLNGCCNVNFFATKTFTEIFVLTERYANFALPFYTSLKSKIDQRFIVEYASRFRALHGKELWLDEDTLTFYNQDSLLTSESEDNKRQKTQL